MSNESGPGRALPIFSAGRRWVLSSVVRAPIDVLRRRRDFAGVAAYCMFVGYPRSGHSISGSLIDAHPNAVIGHELDVLQLVELFPRRVLYSLLLRRARWFAEELGSKWGDYTYAVPGQWQGGRYTRLQVIGDNKGGRSAVRLHERPELLDHLRTKVGVPLRIIHQVRNPYDNISTIARRNSSSIEDAARWYFDVLATTCARTQERCAPQEWLEIRHEDIIAHPRESLLRMCTFLGLATDDAYLDAGAAIVYASSNKSRHKSEWTQRQIDEVAERMAAFDFFAGYTWTS